MFWVIRFDWDEIVSGQGWSVLVGFSVAKRLGRHYWYGMIGCGHG